MVEENLEPAFDTVVLNIRELSKKYGNTKAVDGISLDVLRGEFITLLGPSGSGKTTTLRMIAGFTEPTTGTIKLYGKNITDAAPEKRDIGMVFQNYALFPHMTAAENVAFPLQMRRISRKEIKAKVEHALDLVQLTGFGDRFPRQLSGGQQQRIAIARAVVFQPQLLLMDEPLGALDKKLREELQVEILDIRRRLNATILYVTHDQEEALAMSNRIAIFNKGRIVQIGSPKELYEFPSSLFTAKFMGESTIIEGKLEKDGTNLCLMNPNGKFLLSCEKGFKLNLNVGDKAALVIRPERINIVSELENPLLNQVKATITEVRYFGSVRKYNLQLLDGTPAVIREGTDDEHSGKSVGDEVLISWHPNQSVILAGSYE